MTEPSPSPAAAPTLRLARPTDAPRISALLQRLSRPFLVSPDGAGAERFLASIGEAGILGTLSAANFHYLVAEADGDLAGVVGLRDTSHLFHLFVAERFQGRGWGRHLWQVVRDAALQAGNPGRFTVNASLGAVPVYARFGFAPTGPVQRVSGIAFQPMAIAPPTLSPPAPPARMRCEDIASHPDFRHLSTLAGIDVDLRYAGPHNFVGRDLYGALDCAWLHRQAAERLERAVAWLAQAAPGHRLRILDALRPHRVQVQLWDHLAGTGLRQYVADPALGSVHSFGMALDATLVDADGRELDMGSGFDAMTELSHPQHEARHVASGALTPQQRANRELLRGALLGAGFTGIDNEWWHFNLLDADHVRRHFLRID